jgi:sterol desaturase/sphingolipid hydroxylase (fatty acid hydroxylase superfamily)
MEQTVSPPFLALIPELGGLYAFMFAHDFGRYVFWSLLAWFVLWRLLRGLLAERKIRPKFPPAAQMRREFIASVRTAAVFAVGGSIVVLGSQMGVMQVYERIAERGWGYFWFSLAAMIVLHDAWFYWTHRLIHDPRLFRRFHLTHHRSNNPSPFTAYSFDLGEAAINAAFVPIVCAIMPLSYAATAIFMTHMIARNVIGHAGYELFPATRSGRPMLDWLTTVTHHDIHHAQAGWNYGLYFSWWDRLCGTEHPLYHEQFAAAIRKPLDGSAVQAMGCRSATEIRVSPAAKSIAHGADNIC